MTTPDPLHLPATIPGLLRRGSPVARGNGRGTVTHLSEHGWVIVHDDPLLYDHDDPGFSAGSGDVRHCGWALDLHDATGRVHAAWWLWSQSPESDPVDRTSWVHHDPWGREWAVRGRYSVLLYAEEHVPFGVCVPALAHLNPRDDTRLADGSRRVDALALARVVAHVAGVRHG